MSDEHKMDVWSTSNEKTSHENPAKTNAVTDVNMEKTNAHEDSSSLQKTLKELGDETTHHGVRFVTNNKNNSLRRLLWLALLLVCDSYMCWNIVEGFILYFDYPVNTVVSVTYVDENHEETFEFPAVTLCNFNQFRKSKLDGELRSLIEDVYSPTARFAGESINWTRYSDQLLPRGNSEQAAQATEEVAEFIKSTSHQISDMILECRWRNVVPCDWRDFRQITTDWGVCYTFNNPVNKSEIRKVHQSGSRNGLFLRMNVEQDEYVSGEQTGAGFKVLLHPPGALPLLTEHGFAISPGFETLVAASYTQVKNEPHPYSKCQKSEDVPIEHYSVPLCQYYCKTQYVINECGCKDYRYPNPDAPSCGPQELVECVYPTEAKFISEKIECNCKLPCNADQYQTRTSIAYFPNVHVIEQIKPILNVTEDFLRKNILDMRVFFEELSKQDVSQEPAYPFRTLLSDIGGNMGLMAGMSLITVAETFDFIIKSIWKTFCRVPR